MSSSSLIRAADAVAEQRAVRHDHRRRGRASAGARSLRMMSCRNSSAVSDGLLVARGSCPGCRAPPRRRTAGWSGSRPRARCRRSRLSWHAQAVAVVDLRRLQAVQQQVHLRQQVGQRLGLAARRCCASASVSRSSTVLHLLLAGARTPRPGIRRCRRPGRGRSRPGAGRSPSTMKRTTARGV